MRRRKPGAEPFRSGVSFATGAVAVAAEVRAMVFIPWVSVGSLRTGSDTVGGHLIGVLRADGAGSTTMG
jgi:hypothetical protein